MLDWLRKPKADSGLPAAEDAHDVAILGDIAKIGWSVIQINEGPANPIYSFSVGLYHTHKHPEIIVFGLPHPVAGSIINSIGAMIVLGKKIESDRLYDDFTNSGNVFKTVDPSKYEQYCGYARWLYKGSNFPMLQCVWPLKSGQYPWDAGYPPEGAQFQPLISR